MRCPATKVDRGAGKELMDCGSRETLDGFVWRGRSVPCVSVSFLDYFAAALIVPCLECTSSSHNT